MKNLYKNKPKNMYLLASLVVVLLLLAVAFYFYRQNQPASTEGTTSDTSDNEINYNPPTEEEKQSGNQKKTDIINNEEQQNNNEEQPEKQNVNVIIIDAAQHGDTIEVRAFMPDYFQVGTCTFTFTKGQTSITKQTDAYTDASTTNCRNLNVPRSEFSSGGTWRVIVNYESTNAKGSSAPRELTIQ